MSQPSLFGDSESRPLTDPSPGGDGATSPLADAERPSHDDRQPDAEALAGAERGPSQGRQPAAELPLDDGRQSSDKPQADAEPQAEDARQSGGAAAVPPFEYWKTPVEPGRTLVEASAGTGKTFAIAGLVLKLVLDGDWLAREPGGPPDLRRLLVVTFTNAATDELRQRIRRALRAALDRARGVRLDPGSERGQDLALVEKLDDLLARPDAEHRLLAALDRVDEAGVFTIHGFCKRVLQQAAFESGTPFEMDFVEDADSDALRTRAAADAWARLVHGDALLTAVALHFGRKAKDPLSTASPLPSGRSPEALRAFHKATSDFPSVRILPDTPGLEDALDAVRQSQSALAQAWDADAVADALAELDWNKNAPLATAPEAPDRVAAFARGGDPDALCWALACAPDALGKTATTKSNAQKEAVAKLIADDGIQACGRMAEAVGVLDLAFVRAFVLEVGERVRAIKERRGQLTFADLISRLHDALHDPETGPALGASIRRQFAVAVIDEFQDTDPHQYAIFRTAFQDRPLYFVGDPKQAIYAFRGADVHAYLGAQADADRRFTLGTNWRSTAGLVEAVNRVFERPARAFLFDGIPFRRVAPSPAKQAPRLNDGNLPPLVWWPTPSGPKGALGKGALAEEIPPIVAAEVARLLTSAKLGDRALEASDVAVLVPSRYEAAAILEALRQRGVPAVVSRSNDVRESGAMAGVELVLRAFLRPEDERARRAALATDLWGWTATDLAALDDDPEREAGIVLRLRDGQRRWRRGGVLGALVAFQDQERVVERLLARPDGERWATDLRHATELLHEVEGGGARSPEDLAHWLRHRADQSLPSREMKELRLERDAQAVTITTHHNSKGLEYEVVFLPYLWSLSQRDYEPQTPTLARTARGVVYDLGSDDLDAHDQLRQADALAEAVRRAYVAMTRARERCYVVWGKAGYGRWRLDHRSALGYLLAGHAAEWAGDLAAHVQDARSQAAGADPLDAVRALDPDGDVMRVVEPPAPGSGPDLARAEPERELGEAAGLSPDGHRRARDAWRRASFSGWARHGEPDSGLAAADESDSDARDDATPVGIHAFAAGTGPGTCLHAVLEHARWPAPDAGDDDRQRAQAHNRETVERELQAHGLDRRGRPHRAPVEPVSEVLALLDRVAAAPLFGTDDGAPLRLADAPHRVAEWSFAFPLDRVAPSALADAFRQWGAEPFAAGYADAIAGLSRDAVDGLMVGEVDLVAQVAGRWWVVDWKSNRLGADATAYTPDALAATMTGHHYGLQLHLYTLALHRYLRSRLGDAYDYGTHVGGATYAFLRGMEAGAEAGLFTHRPSAALIDALDRTLAPDA